MLRSLALLLLLANVSFFAWTQGWLDAVVGVSPVGDREPERLARQVRPETITILTPAAVRAADAAAAAARASSDAVVCLEAGPFADTASAAAIAALQQAQVPAGSWTDVRVDRPGAAAPLHMLRVERADRVLAAQLTALRAEALGRGFVPCGG